MDVDLSIPDGAPAEVVSRLVALRQELEEGDITAKGYRKHRDQLLGAWYTITESEGAVVPAPSIKSRRRQSLSESVYSYPTSDIAPPYGIARGESEAMLVPDLSTLTGPLQHPLPPRGIPETARSDPLNINVRLTQFDNLPSILRHRGKTNADITAFCLLDHKGKESQSITWGKLAARSEKVAQQLREQSRLFRGDRVILLYTENEPLEFIAALMGCFIAGLVAVPLLPAQVHELPHIVLSTQCHLILSSETVYKHIHKTNSETVGKCKDIVWWKTSDWGNYTAKRGELPALLVPDLAYIDYARSPTGDLRGVVMSHRTILHQMTSLTAILQSHEVFTGRRRATPDRLLCSLDVRRSTGLILGVLHTIYAGNCTYFIPHRAMTTPGMYAHVISKHSMSIILSDYPALKQVAYNYQSAPEATRNFKKGHKVNLESLRWCLIDAATLDIEFQMVLADRWLKPLGNQAASEIVTPMLTLTDRGGMAIAMRDWLSRQPGDGAPELEKLNLDRTALSHNQLKFVSSTYSDSLEVGAFGFPVPDATVAIVNPDTRVLAQEMAVGEIWVDSPSLSGGFWGMAEDTETIFQAKCFNANGALNMDFMRSGLLGFVHDGQVFILGPLEDRLVQVTASNVSKDSETDASTSRTGSSTASTLVPTYFYSSHLVYTIMRAVTRIYDACVFQMKIDTGLVSVVIVETPVAKPSPYPQLVQPKEAAEKDLLLDDICQQVITLLMSTHGFRVYCVLAAAPNSVPRIIRAGRPDIAKLLARKWVESGALSAAHLKFDIASSVPWIPHGEDVFGGIWSPASSYVRWESVSNGEKQFSGVDMRKDVLDDRSSISLSKFRSLAEIFQWRVSRQPDELAYLTIASRPGEQNKEITWRKLDQMVAAVVHYLKTRLSARAGDICVLMYTHSEDYVVAVLACFIMGLTVIPVSPLDTERLAEDVGSLVKLVRKFKVSLILGNHDTQAQLEERLVTQYLKKHKLTLGKLHNTAKVKTHPSMTTQNTKLDPKYLSNDFAALVWINWTPDRDYIAAEFNHSAILGMCKIQKETCQISSSKPIIGCVRSNCGLGFLNTCCLGPYVGASTLLVSPLDFANNPTIFFLTASRYKVKDGYGTPQMLRHAAKLMKPKGFSLTDLTNLVIPTSGRPDTDLVNMMRRVFGATGLETTAVNTAYGTYANPMITTRSYMFVESIDVWLDPVALRQGYTSLVNPANEPNALHLQDSGMVPINTQVAIVNPETKMLCRAGEFGEIWVASEGNQTQFYKGDMFLNKEVMHARIEDGDPEIKFMRTGDFGFLHTVTKGLDMEMQVLFVLGRISQTVEVNGLQHFVLDVEHTAERTNRSISGACIFTIGNGMTVLVVETVTVKERLCSLVVAIINRILAVHQFAVDIVVFVVKDKIPRSRLGEIQRRSLIDQYVDGTLAIVGQYGVQAQE